MSTQTLLDVALAYQQWEADLVLDNEAWGPCGMAAYPTLTEKLWNRLLEIQAMRNAAVEAATPTQGATA